MRYSLYRFALGAGLVVCMVGGCRASAPGPRSERGGSAPTDVERTGDARTAEQLAVPEAPMPPKPWQGGAEIASNDGTWRIVYKLAKSPIQRGETFSIDAWVFAADAPGVPRADVSLAVDAAMPQHGHGMNRAPHIESLGAGRFRIEGLLFHMPGKWELYFDVARKALVERAQADVEVE